MNTEQLLSFIVNIAEAFKANELKVLKVTEVCGFADYFVIMSGSSVTHVQALAEEILLRCKHAQHPVTSAEGMERGEWCLLDFGDIIVHVFHPKSRAFYDLEGLWREAEIVAVPEPKAGV